MVEHISSIIERDFERWNGKGNVRSKIAFMANPEQSPTNQPLTNDELLLQAEQNLTWARNNYGRTHNDLANTAALVSLAASALVIARAIREQTDIMQEIDLPEIGSQRSEQEG